MATRKKPLFKLELLTRIGPGIELAAGSMVTAKTHERRTPKSSCFWRLSLLLCFGSLLLVPSAIAQKLEAESVLVLYSQEREMGIYAQLDRGLRSQLESGSTQPLMIYTEYLDLLRFPDEDHQQKLVEFLNVKYSNRKIDLIVVVSPLALEFMLKNGGELFKDIPIVFTSVNVHTVAKLSLKPNITGVAVNRNIRDTLDVALRLQPDTTHVIVPGGASPIEKIWTADLRTTLRPYEGRITFSYVNDLSMDDLLRVVSHAPPHTIVLFGALYFYDGTGHYFLPEEALDLIVRASNAPVYGTDQTYMGRGIVGGHLYDMAEVGADAGRIAARILAGESPANIPVQTVNPNYDVFDFRQLKRWGVSEARLPAGSIVRFRQPSFWDLYKRYVLLCVGLFLVQSLLVLALIWQTRRLKQSESGLRVLSQNLINAQEDERKRIARELHDDFSQRLVMLRVEIGLLAGEEDRGQTSIDRSKFGRSKLSGLCSMVDDLAGDMHQLSHSLHSSKLQLLGLKSALKDLCSQVAKGSPMSVEFHAEELSQAVPADIALCFYRVAQEALSNAAKYSGASRTAVSLSNGNAVLTMRISDSGKGFDTGWPSKGLGLASMHERLRLVNGKLVVTSRLGVGTELIAQVLLIQPTQEQRAS